ncbi:MAG: Rid family hydrolase [Haloferacaceae archaeon]
MTERPRVSSGTEWERRVGYSRAIRVDDRVVVAGTTATDDGEVVAPGEPYPQAVRAIENVAAALAEADAALDDVVRTRPYVTDADDWEAVGRAHAEAFGETHPTTTLVEVARLVDPRLVVEMEAEAVV